MSSESARKIEAPAEITADTVADYLATHPDFFETYPQLLDNIELSHSAGPKAVSLIERQVSVLRDKNQALEKQMLELVDVARSNEQFVAKIDKLAVALLACRSRDDIVALMEETLRAEFGAEHSVMVLFLPSASGREPETRFLRVIDRKDPALSPFKTFLEIGDPRSGFIRDTQRDFLFGSHSSIEIGSAALVPLGDGCATGFLAIGSSDANYFHPGQGMDFLTRMGDLVAAALSSR